MGLDIGDLVRLVPPPDKPIVGVVVDKDDMGYFIMNYLVRWVRANKRNQNWYREDELEKI